MIKFYLNINYKYNFDYKLQFNEINNITFSKKKTIKKNGINIIMIQKYKNYKANKFFYKKIERNKY